MRDQTEYAYRRIFPSDCVRNWVAGRTNCCDLSAFRSMLPKSERQRNWIVHWLIYDPQVSSEYDLPAFRLTLACVSIFTKFANDFYYSNTDISATCGISKLELQALELYTLELLDWEVFVSEEEYGNFQNLLSDAFRKQILSKPFPESPEWVRESVGGLSNEAQKDDTHMANSDDSSFDGELDERKDAIQTLDLPVNLIFSPKSRSFSLR